MISTDRLVRLLNILEINVKGGDRISPISDVSSYQTKKNVLIIIVYRNLGG